MMNAIGCIELNSIAKGYLVADTMIKAAHSEIIINRSICPGKYMIVIGGDVAAVKASIQAGIATSPGDIIDDIIIPQVHPEVFQAIGNSRIIENPGALGVVETFSVATIIEAADAAVKAASVELMEIHLAMAIGGKGYFTLTGDVASVEAAVNAAAACAKDKGNLVNKVVIAHPKREIINYKL